MFISLALKAYVSAGSVTHGCPLQCLMGYLSQSFLNIILGLLNSYRFVVSGRTNVLRMGYCLQLFFMGECPHPSAAVKKSLRGYGWPLSVVCHTGWNCCTAQAKTSSFYLPTLKQLSLLNHQYCGILKSGFLYYKWDMCFYVRLKFPHSEVMFYTERKKNIFHVNLAKSCQGMFSLTKKNVIRTWKYIQPGMLSEHN